MIYGAKLSIVNLLTYCRTKTALSAGRQGFEEGTCTGFK